MANRYMQGIFMAAAVSVAGASASAALVAKYDFNDQNPTTATDSAGTAQNGTINGGASYAASPVGGAGTNYGLLFDGTDDYVGFVNNTGTDATLSQSVITSGKYSIEIWVNDISTVGSAEPQLFGQDTSTLGITRYSTNAYTYAMAGANNTATAVPSGYHHVVATYDPTLANNQLQIYLDGVFAAAKDFGGSPPTLSPSTSVEYRSGRGGPGDPNSYLIGFIDEIRYYDNALSSADVLSSFQAGPTLIPEPASIGAAAIGLLLAGRRVRKA